MALTYDQSATLMIDSAFRGRVKVSCLKFAESIIDEAGTVPGHGARYRWAQQCMQSPDMTAQTVQAPTVMDPNVQSAGSTIDDATLQSAVEATIEQML